MPSIWRSHFDQTIARQDWAQNAQLPVVVEKVLRARGVSSPEILDQIISPKLNTLQDPYSILGMDKAVQRLILAFRSQEPIAIYADFDLDGTSGLALLKYGLADLGFQNIFYYQPKRLSEGYGFHAHAVEELAAKGIKLIVTVDVGITALAACQKAKDLGVDVIITDHHQPAEVLPEALAICNPNQSECTSQLKYLCGAGVAFYLLRALKRGLVNLGLVNESTLELKSVLDFFTIATLTDMVPLVEDNRILVKVGLQQLQNTQRPGLKALLSELGLNGRVLTSQDVAIRFAPKLNALSRMELGLLPLDIFLMENEAEAKLAVKKVLKNNQTRVELQQEGENEALEQLKTWNYNKFVCLQSPNFHRGVVGLIATKISQLKNLPTFIGSLSTTDRLIVGSARAAGENEENSVLTALEYCQEYLTRFGGHHAAAGFELHESKWPSFVEKMFEFYEKLNLEERVKEIIYDSEINLAMINESLMRWFDHIGPFGQAFQAPLLRIQNVKIQSSKQLTGGHLKVKLSCLETQRSIEGLWFSPPAKHKELILDNHPVEVLAEVQWNYFAGKKTLQVMIKEMRTAHAN
jgi:single-stranded-DNA-specific exonuclease